MYMWVSVDIHNDIIASCDRWQGLKTSTMSVFRGPVLISENASQCKRTKAFCWEMTDLRTGVGNVQNEPGTFCALK